MKKTLKLIIPVIVILLFLTVPTAALAQPLYQTGQVTSGDQVIFGDNYVLQSGQTLNGDLVVLGGNATIASGATVNGDIALLGGNLDLTGSVNGDIAAIGANVSLAKGALVSGEVVSMGGNVTGAELGTIRGGIRTFTPRALLFDGDAFRFPQTDQTSPANTVGGWILGFLGKIMQLLAMAVLAVIVVLLLPRPANRVADSIANQPWMSGGAGLLTLLVAPFVLLILTITIILIPLTILAALALAVAIIFGWIALGFQIGRRMEVLFKTQWADAVSAGIGTLVLGIVVAVLGYVPCVGGLIGFVAACAGLGGVVLSGFGSRTATPTGTPPEPVIEVIPPASPASTAPPEVNDNSNKL
ncbi:MAG: hypothetical protein A2X24_03980 [Chloroflexi bacterium GWB2_54_36]|nr:MAG: hypothetical protein A2X24_03980 [Chloroflexi bacterium GWB2_54_36]